MQRPVAAPISVALTLCLSFGLSLSVTGCGDDGNKQRVRRSIPRARPLQPERPLTPEEIEERDYKRAVMAKDVWIWPEGSSEPAPDVIEDTKACEAAAQSTPSVKYANPLVKLSWLAGCMQRKGWAKNPDSKTLGQMR